MNKQDYSNLGGQPVDLDSLNFMQTAYTEGFAAVAALIGNKCIAGGVDVVGTTVTDGYISYNGEILKFVGCPVAANVAIIETATALIFDDGTTHNVEYIRYATCSPTGLFPFADLKRPAIYTTGDIKEKIVTAAYIAANFDNTTGVGYNEQAGWAILSLQVPATAGRMFINYDPANPLFSTVGNIGGAIEATLSIANLPNHKHTGETLTRNESIAPDGKGFKPDNYNNTVGDTSSVGGDQPFSLLNPYFVTLKLIRL